MLELSSAKDHQGQMCWNEFHLRGQWWPVVFHRGVWLQEVRCEQALLMHQTEGQIPRHSFNLWVIIRTVDFKQSNLINTTYTDNGNCLLA